MPISESLRGTVLFASNIVTGLVVIIHFYFLILEMFLWSTPFGLKVFRQTLERAQNSSALAANQGLYNGFLAAGLIGGYTVSYRIIIFQALPAALAISLLLISKGLA